MTPETIGNMELGPEMDLLIAEKVMGYPILDITPPCDHNVALYRTHIAVFSPAQIHYHRALGNEGKNYMWGIWQPSKDIAQAWEVWDEMGFTILKLLNGGYEVDESGLLASTAPLAICRAALKSVCTP